MSEQINPDHYKKNKVETIQSIMDQLSHDEVVGYLKGNIFKYLNRFGSKHGDTLEAKLMDLGKAEWYLNKLFKILNDNG